MKAWASLGMAAFLMLVAAGCGEEERYPEKGKVRTREVIGKTTQEVRPVEPEIQKGAQVVEQPKVIAKDPITMPGNVYVVAVDRQAAGMAKHAIDLYQAEHGEYPKNFEEFQREIMKPGQPDGLRLPQLPYYQEYSYDEKEHKLIILEYPQRKVDFQKQQDARFGR